MDYLIRGVNSAMSLYMILILLRWFGPYLELDLYRGWFRWVAKLTDPLIGRIRRVLPSMGPLDFGPLATLLLVWLVREAAVTVLLSSATPPPVLGGG